MRTKIIIATVGLIVGVIVGGFAGTTVERRSSDARVLAAVQQEATRGQQLEVEVSTLRRRGALAELHLRLGRIAVEADRQDYGTAGERAARFFDDAARLASATTEGGSERSALRHVLAARDEIIAGLATAQPATAQKLGQLYLDVLSMMPVPSLDEVGVIDERPAAGAGRSFAG